MEAEIEDKLDELLELTRDNNKMLRAMHRRVFWGQVTTYIYWLVILGVAGWSYLYIQPYLSKYMNAYNTIMSAVNTQNSVVPSDIDRILEALQKARQ